MHSGEFVIMTLVGIGHMELEISRFSFCLVKVQMEKVAGVLVEEMTNKTGSVLRRMHLAIL